ncbi:hypothetical protein [Gordonia sp. VNK21]|uniref:hypothetical protein n=1 Tax=Gordonia sp. VNK21 TaxID=3382483 RepID=UPI0038D488AA
MFQPTDSRPAASASPAACQTTERSSGAIPETRLTRSSVVNRARGSTSRVSMPASRRRADGRRISAACRSASRLPNTVAKVSPTVRTAFGVPTTAASAPCAAVPVRPTSPAPISPVFTERRSYRDAAGGAGRSRPPGGTGTSPPVRARSASSGAVRSQPRRPASASAVPTALSAVFTSAAAGAPVSPAAADASVRIRSSLPGSPSVPARRARSAG